MAERQFFVITEIPDSVYYDAIRGGGRQFNESRRHVTTICIVSVCVSSDANVSRG